MTTVPTGSRARTRQAILDAAVEVMARNPSATLGDVAVAADVGRTTLHRYFPERSDLINALHELADGRLEQATGRARLGDGSAVTALQRLCREYFDLGDVLSLLFRDQVNCEETGGEASACDEDFEAMIRRGHTDGSIDRELPALWIQSLLWSQLYAGWSYMAEHGVSRHEALRLVERCVGAAVRPFN